MIIVLFEATGAVADMLQQPPRFVADRPQSRHTGPAPTGNVAVRDWYEHHVMMGNDARQPVLMAARKNNWSFMECHTSETWADGVFKGGKGKRRIATTKIMVCTFH